MVATVIGRKKSVALDGLICGQVGQNIPVAVPIFNPPAILPDTFPMAIDNAQMQEVNRLLLQVDFIKMTRQEVAVLCSEVEKNFNQVLDGFLSRINEFDNPKITKLLKTLSVAVGEQDLTGLAGRILNEKPGAWDMVKGKISGLIHRMSDDEQREKYWEETKELLKMKSTTLKDIVAKMEKDLETELQKLDENVEFMEETKEAYRQHFASYIVAVAFTSAFFARSKNQVEQYKQSLDMGNMLHQRDYNEMTDKLQALESRALALEGTLTSLPADDLVIRQLQNAGITTIQEVRTTVPARFANIKMTVLKLHSAMITQGVQNLAQHGANLDKSLHEVGQKLTKQVVTHAANAPGENRKAQARQILSIVAETKELMQIAEQGSKDNQKKFDETRQMFADARKAMLQIGQRA